MYNRFWCKVTDFMKASLFGRTFLSVVFAIGSAFRQSWIYSFFSSKNMTDYGQSSKIAQFIRRILFESEYRNFASKSVLVWLFSEMPKSVFFSSVYLLSSYILPAGIVLFVASFGNITNMLISAVIIVFAASLFGIKTTVGNVMVNSYVLKKICEFFYIDTQTKPVKNYKKRLYVFTVLFGLIAGFSAFILDFKLALLLFFAILFLPMLISSPMLLLTLTFFGGIALSTMPAVVLSITTLIVVLCRLCNKSESLPKLRTPYILVLLYLAIVLFITFAGFASSDSMLAGIIQFVLLTTFFSVVVVINNYDKLKKLIYSVTVCSLYPCFVGIYQLLSGQGGTGWTAENYVGGLARITSTFLNPNVYGEFLIFSICMSVVAILVSYGIKQKTLFSIIAVLQIINLALTYSRGCYLSIAFAALVIVWCCDKRLLSFGIFAVPAIPHVLPKNIITRILSVGSYLKDTSTLYRFSIWKGALRVIKNHWFMGTGIGTVAFSLFYQNYMLAGAIAQHSHNTYMQIAIELSALGLIIFLLIVLYAVKDASNVARRFGLKAKLVVVPLIASFGAVLIQGFFDYIFYNNIVFMVYWFVMGLTVASFNVVSSDNYFCENNKEGKQI